MGQHLNTFSVEDSLADGWEVADAAYNSCPSSIWRRMLHENVILVKWREMRKHKGISVQRGLFEGVNGESIDIPGFIVCRGVVDLEYTKDSVEKVLRDTKHRKSWNESISSIECVEGDVLIEVERYISVWPISKRFAVLIKDFKEENVFSMMLTSVPSFVMNELDTEGVRVRVLTHSFRVIPLEECTCRVDMIYVCCVGTSVPALLRSKMSDLFPTILSDLRKCIGRLQMEEQVSKRHLRRKGDPGMVFSIALAICISLFLLLVPWVVNAIALMVCLYFIPLNFKFVTEQIQSVVFSVELIKTVVFFIGWVTWLSLFGIFSLPYYICAILATLAMCVPSSF